MKKILLIGETDNINSTTVEISQTFTKMGYFVDSFNFRSKSLNYCKYKFIYRYLDFIFKKLNKHGISYFYYNFLGRNQMKLDLLNKNFNEYKFILFTKCEYIDPAIFLEIKKITPVYYFFFDTILDINNYNLYNHFNFATKSFVVSKKMVNILNKNKNIYKKIFYCPQGVNLNKWKNNNYKKIYDVVFIGTRTNTRSKYIEFLKNKGINIMCYGIGFENGILYNEDLNQLYQKTKIALNFSRDKDSFSIRVYQIMASGCLVISTISDELKDIFVKGVHFDDFASPDDCYKKIIFYLSDNISREKISKKALNKVSTEFSWEKALNHLLV